MDIRDFRGLSVIRSTGGYLVAASGTPLLVQLTDVEKTLNNAGVPFAWESPTTIAALGCVIAVDGNKVHVGAVSPEGEVDRLNEILGLI